MSKLTEAERKALRDILFAACPNCDGRQCMDCVFRVYDHQCGWTCPDCGPETPQFVNDHSHRRRVEWLDSEIQDWAAGILVARGAR